MAGSEPGWRDVAGVAALAVAAVLALQLIAAGAPGLGIGPLLPGLGEVLARYPTVIVVLGIVTVVLVGLALRPRGRG